MKKNLTTPNGTVINLAKVNGIEIDTHEEKPVLTFIDHKYRCFLTINDIPLSILHLFMNVIDRALVAYVNGQIYSPDWSFMTNK